jgi:hypothetical protein
VDGQRHGTEGDLTLPDGGRRRWAAGDPTARLLTVGAALLCAGVALGVGLTASGGGRVGAVLPLVVLAGLAVGVLALTRFAA